MMYEGWEDDADRKADDSQEGWDLMTQMIMEDEEWARVQFEAFHGREY